MWMAEISVDLIQMVYYHADSCAINPSAFLFLEKSLPLLLDSVNCVIINGDYMYFAINLGESRETHVLSRNVCGLFKLNKSYG